MGFGSFAQNVDWINAPLNPVPKRANLKTQNLKGDVFQLDFVNYSRDGKWELSPVWGTKDKLEFDAMGRLIKDVDVYGSVTNYTYDKKGNLIQEHNAFSNSTYTYDDKNRLIKVGYLDKLNKNHNIEYAYKQQKEILIVTELKTATRSKQVELEIHYKNGLKVYEKVKDGYATVFAYEMDNTGNWVTKTITNEATKTTNSKSVKRDIIYYDDLNRNIEVVVDKIYGSFPRLVPNAYINDKKYHLSFSRFNDDYVIFDVLSKTYYVAREAYSKKNIEGQKISVEKLISGHEIIMLFDGRSTEIVENGRTKNDKIHYTLANYWGNFFARDSVSGRRFVFAKPQTTTPQKTIAMAAINMKDDANKVLYIYNKQTTEILLFDRGEVVEKPKLSGFSGVNNDYVMADKNTPKYVLTGVTESPNQTVARGRYFNSAKDKLITVKPKTN